MAGIARRSWAGPLGAAALLVAALVGAGNRSARRRRAAPPGPRAFDWPTGLTEAEASDRWIEGQSNTAHLKPVRTWAQVRSESVFTVFNLNLIGLALVQGLLSEWWGAFVTLALLALTTGIRVGQQRLAITRLARFRAASDTTVAVIREARLRSIDPDRIVPGDIVVVGPGDQLVVDGMLLGPGSLTVDTSVLTGRRGWQRIEPGGAVHGGTFCAAGRAVYRAERVGAQRLVSSRLADRPTLAATPTPLERLVARILGLLLVVVLLYAALLLAAYLRLDLGAPGDLIAEAAPVIFSLAPSGLYLMIIVSYATGTAELAQRGALVHNARSVESLAETTVLCFTEVGILAGTSMELAPVEQPGGDRVSESRLRQVLGDFARTTAAPSGVARQLADEFDGERRAVRDEAAHLTTLGWSAIAFGEPDAQGVYVVGEPHALAGHLAFPLPDDTDADPDAAAELLVLAHRPDVVPLRDAAGRPQLPDGLIPLGTLRFRAQVRPEAMRVVREFLDAGVRVKAFAAGRAGDAVAALRSAGLSPEDEQQVLARGVLSRAELEALPRSDWGRAAAQHSLFGGLTAFQVGELVRALRNDGEIVTVVGDGVADLPALAEANLAVAQPASTQAALGLADIVLLANSPSALARVLTRGQAIVRGLVDILKLNLTMVLCSALLIVSVRLLSVGFPYLAGQGSIVSILAVTIPSLVFSLSAPPGAVSHTSYAATLIRFVVPAGASLSLAAFLVYLTVLQSSGRVAHAQLAVTYTLLYSGLVLGVVIRRSTRFTLLAGVLAAVGTLLPLIPQARRQFRLDWMEPTEYGIVALTVVAWLGVVTLLWWFVGHRPPGGFVLKRLRRAPRSP